MVVGGVVVGLRWPVMTLDGLVAEAGEALGRARSFLVRRLLVWGLPRRRRCRGPVLGWRRGWGSPTVSGKAGQGQVIAVMLTGRCRRWIPPLAPMPVPAVVWCRG